MSFEIKQKTLVKVKIYGEEFELRKPTVEQIEDLEQSSVGDDGKQSKKQVYENMCNMLDKLGLPKEFSKDMEVDHLNKLIEYLGNQFNDESKAKKK